MPETSKDSTERVKEEIPHHMFSVREKEICFRCTAVHANAIAVAVLGAVCI